jgi:hypothetical protein
MRSEWSGENAFRFPPEITRLLAIGWVATFASAYLFPHDGWLVFPQLFYFAAATAGRFRIGPHFGEFWRGWFIDFAVVTMLFAAAFPLGAILVARVTTKKNLLQGLFALAVGLWALAVLVLVIAWFDVRWVPVAFTCCLLWFLPEPRHYFRPQTTGASRLRWSAWEKLLLAFLGTAAIFNLPGAMTPPFEYDELEYHLGALAEYIKAGRVVFLPHNFYSNLPQLTEMLYLLGLVSGSDMAAKLLHWSFGVLGAVAVFATGMRVSSRRVALTAAASFYCAPFVQDLSGTARIDLATAFFAILVFAALLSWREPESLWLAGFASGIAVATKWTAIPVVLLPAVLFVFAKTKSVSRSSLFCLLSIALVLPWLLKNLLLAGNPVYPMFSTWFHNPHWSAEQARLFVQKHFPTFHWHSLLLPWQYSVVDALATPILLMTAPLVLLLRNVRQSVRHAGWLFFAAYVGWFVLTFRPWRFLLPAIPLATIVGAYSLDSVSGQRWLRNTLHLIVGIILGAGLATIALSQLVDVESPRRFPPQLNFVQYVLGSVSRDEFVARIGHGALEPILWMNTHLPADAKVLYIGEARAYYAKHDVVWSTAFDQHPLTTMTNFAGITHVYVNASELERLHKNYGYLRKADLVRLDEFLRQHARPIHQSGRSIVYEVEPAR